MRILIVSATQFEIEPTIMHFAKGSLFKKNCFYSFHLSRTHQVDFLITGPGLHHTAFHLSRTLSMHTYDMAVNAGICGAYNKKFLLGDVVEIKKETIADFGAESKVGFIPASKLGLYMQNETFIANDSILNNTRAFNLPGNPPKVNGITVNTVHGQQASIEKIKRRLKPDVESMEGFAFFYACKYHKIPFYAFRAVSNYVEPRNKNNWNIPIAIHSLNEQIIKMSDTLFATWK